ncbi:hypothetical protein [Parasitella parasitica]|uniref:Zn(2)-C6 fungal-type domain-containing protein n=1 Tax=Parasitella parasitica TaxID=35722 RepID=A0A0B7MVL2_9FUNG|nr:hypothetical protein [Parasitella parasitica]
MSQHRKKKTVEYHFVDMNDPDRYKKIKVARACDFCRKRKSKCDIGIPGSGTCSNCKKSNTICIFSPVSSSTASSNVMSRKERPNFQASDSASLSYIGQSSSSLSSRNKKNVSNVLLYQAQNPFLSMDQRGHCGYDKHDTVVHNNAMLASSPIHKLPPYTKQMEQELFDVYFCHVHPFFPILDRYCTLQALKYDAESIPTSLKLAVIAVSLHFTHQQQDADLMATAYYQHASMQLDHTPSLASLQTLFLLYKFQELITPVGSSLSTVAVDYLREIQTMISQLLQQQAENENGRVVWSTQDEFVCRAGWIVFIIVTFSSTADDRWKNILDCQDTMHRSKLPSLTETEHYDTGELNTFCNFMYLIKIASLYSQTLALISDQSSLFVNADHPEFPKLAQGLDNWRSSLPSRISLALSVEPPILYSAQNHDVANIAYDSSKSGSFTAYICLIHDILDLIISIHRSSSSSKSELAVNPQDLNIFKKASLVCYRAHSFTTGDMQTPHFSRLASIQGGRIVSFGLTLALQAQSHMHEQSKDKSLANAKLYYSSCSLAFLVFDDMLLSPQLYMAIQTLRAQLEAKEQLVLADHHQPQQQQQQHYEHSPVISSKSSSTRSTPGALIQHDQNDYGFTAGSATSTTTTAASNTHNNSNTYYSYSHTSDQYGTNEQSQYQHQPHSSPQQTQQQQQWQNYINNNNNSNNNNSNNNNSNNNNSYNTTTTWFSPSAQQEQNDGSYYPSSSSQDGDYSHHNSVPITPIFERDFGMSTSPLLTDPLTPPPVTDTDSYFALQQQVPPHPQHQQQLQHLQLMQQQYSSFDAAIAIVSNSSDNHFNMTIQYS